MYRQLIFNIMKKTLLVLLLSINYTGCSLLLSQDKKIEVQKFEFNDKKVNGIVIDSYTRAINSIGNKYCSEPSPDFTQTYENEHGDKFGLGKKIAHLEAELTSKSKESSNMVTDRTEIIAKLCDSMYRLCEGYLNKALDDLAFRKMHRIYLNMSLVTMAMDKMLHSQVLKQNNIDLADLMLPISQMVTSVIENSFEKETCLDILANLAKRIHS